MTKHNNQINSAQKRRRKALVYERDQGLCFWCDRGLSYESATMDHIVPRSAGGRTEINNMVLSCLPCNARRGSMNAFAFAKKTFGGAVDGQIQL